MLARMSGKEAYEEHLAHRFTSTRAPRLIAACRDLKQEGALGAKFSGAGGEGSVIALLPDAVQAQQIAARLRQGGLEAWEVPLRRSQAD